MSDNKALLIADMPSEIFNKIQEDMTKAMKSGDSFRVQTLRYILSELKNGEIEARGKKLEFRDEDVLKILSKQVKQREESIAEFKKGNRQDLVDKESNELAILSEYLPAQLTEVEIAALVNEAVLEVNATSMADMGKVMEVLMTKVRGRADGKLVSELVKNTLSS